MRLGLTVALGCAHTEGALQYNSQRPLHLSQLPVAELRAHMAAGGVRLQAQPQDAGDAGNGAEQWHPLHRIVWQHGERSAGICTWLCVLSCTHLSEHLLHTSMRARRRCNLRCSGRWLAVQRMASRARKCCSLMCCCFTQELEAGVVKVKDLAANTQDDVPVAELAADLKRRIAAKGEYSIIAAGAAAQPAAAAPPQKQAAAA